MDDLKPRKRSALRLKLGKLYYTLRQYGKWCAGGAKYGKQRQETELAFLYTDHRSLLLRQLKDVEMEYQHNKIINLRIASQKLNGVVLRPGETFSYWRCIGKPTAKKGYVAGMVLNHGSFGPGTGGGLCQMSNLIYWMTLHTPLTVTERYRHSYDVFPDAGRTQPFGSGATCVYPYRDLSVKNETPYTFQLVVEVGSTHLMGQWRCSHRPEYRYEVVEKNHCMKGEYWGGFSRHNELYRKKYTLEGELLGEEWVTENHAVMMYEPFLAESPVSEPEA